MAEAFIGFGVSVKLLSGLNLTGTVAELDPSTQQLTLRDVQLFFPGHPPHHTPIYGIYGRDISDLQVVSQPVVAPSTQGSSLPLRNGNHQRSEPSDAYNYESTASDDRQSRKLRPKYKEEVDHAKRFQNHQQQKRKPNHTTGNVTANSPAKSSSFTTKRSLRHAPNGGWADEDVDGFKEKEFDFQANLDMFDKAKVFAEIRQSDETSQDGLLVTLNRLPQKQRNLLPTENVLDSGDEDTTRDTQSGSIGDESDTESQSSPDKNHIATSHGRLTPKPLVRLQTTKDGIACTRVSPLQLARAEHECLKLLGPFEDQLIENGGRGTSAVALQIIEKIRSSTTPIIVILAGNNKTGAYGFSAARHLINHGCYVIVCVADQPHTLCESVARQKVMFPKLGGEVIYNLKGLDGWHPHLIIDAMMGAEHQICDLQDENESYEWLYEMIKWTETQSVSVLSIDFPSGVDGSTGESQHPLYSIHPAWTVCLGAPMTGCVSKEVTGELYIVDIGIPKISWERAGIKDWEAPWDIESCVALEYA